MRDLLRWLLVAAAVLTANAAVADRDIDGVPIPDAVPIADAAPGISAPQSFQGAWVGRWGGQLKHILIVERVTPDGTASVVYAVGGAPGSHSAHEGRVSGDMLKVALGGGMSATYQMTSANWVEARHFGAHGFDGEVELNRMSVAALDGMKFADSEGESVMIDSGLRDNGQPVRLEVVVFKPAGKGPFPLLVVNHGSTGDGKFSGLFRLTFAKRAFAKIFVDKGYLVAYPQRRGRGRSDGLYDEGFNADRTLGYTCEPERSLAGADRALEDIEAAVKALKRWPDVKAEPVLMAGFSRGGALSVAYAGKHPNDVAGVINFVGGWLDTKDCRPTASGINQNLLRRGAAFRPPTLWLYGYGDSNYSIEHSRENFHAFEKDGGEGRFLAFDVPLRDGHDVMLFPSLWTAEVDRYLGKIRTSGKD